MSRASVLAALALTSAAAAPSVARAQIVADDGWGYSPRTVLVSLTGGRTYSFATQESLSPVPGTLGADSVLSVGPYGANHALAGGDGCYTSTGFQWEPSCFDFTPATSGYYILYLRAWRTYTPGQTSLYMKDVTAGGGWTTVASGLSFGGAVGTTNVSSGRLFLHTQHRPGNSTYHTIWSAMSNEWQLVRRTSGNGRVGGTAMIDVPDVAGANLGGQRRHIAGAVFEGVPAPIRLLRNTWFQPGQDYDGDGLGAPLEVALRTCDGASSPDPSPGFRCADLPGCAAPGSALCKSSLRDTDHDGLRDDLETWGYDDPLLHIARWGADPARMDVFIEVDTYDQNLSSPSTCEGLDTLSPLGRMGGDTTGTVDFFERLQRVYSDLPSSLHFNPDGSQGIRLHLDVGVSNPDPTDVRWGNWGGGNTCVLTTVGCSYQMAYNNACGSPTLGNGRKWVFFYGLDNTAVPGQASGVTFTAQNLSHWAHELGHLGQLGHRGPPGSAAEHGHFGNFRPQYPSRINYAFQDVGGTTGIDGVSWAKVSFSSGNLVAPLSNLAAPETCPFPGEDLSVLGLTAAGGGLAPGEQPSWNPATSCWDVDWDFSGGTAGTTYLERLSQRSFLGRWSNLNGGCSAATGACDLVAQPSAWTLATIGDVLLFGRVHRYATGDEVVFRADGDAECLEYPLDIRGAPLPYVDADFWTGGAYPGCVRPGRTTVRPGLSALAAAATSGLAYVGGVLEEAGILVRNDLGTLRWDVLEVAPATSSTEMAFGATAMGVIGADIATCEGCAEPALVRMPSDATLLVYRDPTGNLLQRTLAPGTILWSTSTSARSGGTPLTSPAAVSLAERDGKVWMAATDPLRAIRIYENVDGDWALRANLGPTSATPLRPSIAIADDFELPSKRRMWVYYLAATAGTAGETTLFRRSALDDFTSFGPATAVLGPQPGAAAPTAIWDDRSVGDPDLRLVRGTQGACPCASPWVCDPTINRCRDAGGARIAMMEYAPFSRGPWPGVFTDYDDWQALRVGFCRSIDGAQNTWAPDFTDGYVPTSHRTSQDCGPVPVYAEPTPGGMSIVIGPPPDEETLRPWLYTPRGEVVCGEEHPW